MSEKTIQHIREKLGLNERDIGGLTLSSLVNLSDKEFTIFLNSLSKDETLTLARYFYTIEGKIRITMMQNIEKQSDYKVENQEEI